MNKHRKETIARLARVGIADCDIDTLLRVSSILHTWAERECNGNIQRDEQTGKPYWYNADTGKRLYRTADRETPALYRAHKVALRYGYDIYHQTDPRGCALYLYTMEDLGKYNARNANREPCKIDSCYSSIGIPVIPR